MLAAFNLNTPSTQSFFKDGVLADTFALPTAALVTPNEIIVGGRNVDGTPQFFIIGTVSTALMGAVMADQVAHNTNVRALLTSLGTTLP